MWLIVVGQSRPYGDNRMKDWGDHSPRRWDSVGFSA